MKILVAPLNWGLGHASRCVPLVQRFIDEGHEVILGGDGESLTLLRRHFPKLRYIYLAPLHLHYSAGKSQVWAMLKAIPKILVWSRKDHAMLQAVLREEHIDRVVSDNRFGLYTAKTECIYITHQLHIFLPKGWKWAEGIASRMHARIYTRYNKVWIPDREAIQDSLGGALSHPKDLPPQAEYIGSLSRFALLREGQAIPEKGGIVAVLSGLEPQRSLLEASIAERYRGSEEAVFIVQGLVNRPPTRMKRGNITLIPHMKDKELADLLRGAKHIIARSGYSTIMDFEALGILAQTEFIPTPGQPEQEYLASWIAKKCTFC